MSDPNCARCNGTQTVCLNCKQAIDDCECEEDSMPCFCDECHSDESPQGTLAIVHNVE